MKYLYSLPHLLLILFISNINFTKETDWDFCKYVYASESETINGLLGKVYSSSKYQPWFFEHKKNLFEFKSRETLKDNGLSINMIFTADFVTNRSEYIEYQVLNSIFSVYALLRYAVTVNYVDTLC